MIATAALLSLTLAAGPFVPAGADLAAALASARPGDVVRLGPGVHAGTLGRVRGPLRVEGAGAGITQVVAPEGEDGLVVEGGEVSLSGLTLQAGPRRVALRVLGGQVAVRDAALVGDAAAAFLGGGRLSAREVGFAGAGYGLLVRAGVLEVVGGWARGGHAGVAQLGGQASIRGLAVTGPASEAGVSVSGGQASLDELVIRSPGPSGLSVLGEARVEARELTISGAREELSEGVAVMGDCIQVRRGTLHLAASVLTRCGGAAVEALGGTLELRGVDATGGAAGCLVFLDHATARLDGNLCARRGPAVVAAGGAQVTATMDRWRTDPVLWVECGSGARVHLGVGETAREPCQKH